MHYSCFSDCINVEKTPEQCCLGCRNYKGLKGVSDGMGAQVEVQMINKCKAQMIRKNLYNVKKPPWSRGGKKKEDNILACKRTLMWWSVLINKIPSLLGLRFFDDNSFYSCLFVPQFHASHCSTHLNLVLRPILYKIHCIGLFWTRIPCGSGLSPNFVPTIGAICGKELGC